MSSGNNTSAEKSFLFARPKGWAELPEGSLVLQLKRYRETLRVDSRLPSRRQIDPVEIGAILLPWIFLLDVVRDGDRLDYLYRLVGTSNVELVGRDPTGRLASEIFATEERRFLMETFELTVTSAAPTYWYAEAPQESYGRVRIYRGLFPLSDNGIEVDKLLCIAVPDDA